MKQRYYVGTPNLVDKKKFFSMINKIWKSKRLSNDGPYVKEFEHQIKQFLNVPHAIVVCNATIGLQILAKVLFNEKLFIVPSFTFAATVYALDWIGFNPMFADIDLETHNILPITYANYPIVATHIWGRPCPIEALTSNKVPVIFDAAHAFGCSYNGIKIGNFGGGEVFSFHATKFINSFEGGVITTRSDETAEKCRLFRNFGFEGYDNSITIGINAKMNEVQAAMGLCSLDDYDKIVAHNKNNYDVYCEKLDNIEGIKVVKYNPEYTPNYQYMVIEIEKNRDSLYKFLWDNDIFVRRYFYPGVHNMAHYKSFGSILPKTDILCDRVMVLPNGTSINEKDVKRICKFIRKGYKNE